MLFEPNSAHFDELLSWVNSSEELRSWAGPNVRFPFDATTLKQDLFTKGWCSYMLISSNHELLGFGQYYVRVGHCHLCRLIISPLWRGQGLARILIEKIAAKGQQDSQLNASSLFVYENNHAAIRAYEKVGFSVSDSPNGHAMKNCLYMVKH